MATRAIEVVDIYEPDDLVRLIDRFEVNPNPVILRRNGREVAILIPLASAPTTSDPETEASGV